jgi:hypothetical protein
MTDEQLDIARRYAYMFFVRVPVPLPAVSRTSERVQSLPVTREALLPGADSYLDFVCERILSGGDFLLPDDLIR